MNEIPIEQIYNDIVKCSEMTNLIRPGDNSFIMLIPIVLDLKSLPNEPLLSYEIEFVGIHQPINEMRATYIEVEDENYTKYHKTNIIYKFLNIIDQKSIIYTNIYGVLEPLIKVIKRDQKLTELGL